MADAPREEVIAPRCQTCQGTLMSIKELRIAGRLRRVFLCPCGHWVPIKELDEEGWP